MREGEKTTLPLVYILDHQMVDDDGGYSFFITMQNIAECGDDDDDLL